MVIRVTLTDTDLEMAKKYAKMRRDANRRIGTTDQAYIKGSEADLVGIKGEIAASIATGIPWENYYTPPEQRDGWLKAKMPDLGEDIEVRTVTKPTHRLIVHKRNPTEWRYLLVYQHTHNQLNVVGWQHGETIKQDQYWEPNFPEPAYAYPQRLLRPIEELAELRSELLDRLCPDCSQAYLELHKNTIKCPVCGTTWKEEQ